MQYNSAWGSATSGDNLVPEDSCITQRVIHLAGQLGRGNAEKLAEDGLVILDEVAIVINQLDSACLGTSSSGRWVNLVVAVVSVYSSGGLLLESG